jgi:hypothetical protein
MAVVVTVAQDREMDRSTSLKAHVVAVDPDTSQENADSGGFPSPLNKLFSARDANASKRITYDPPPFAVAEPTGKQAAVYTFPRAFMAAEQALCPKKGAPMYVE